LKQETAAQLVKAGTLPCPAPLVLLERDTSAFVGLLPCRTWACESCSVFLRRRLFARASAAFSSIPSPAPVSLLTFTMRRLDWATRSVSAAVALLAWRRWLQQVRKAGWEGRFLRVVEAHKSGIPHFHVIVDRWLPSNFLSKLWNSCLKLAWRTIVGVPTFNAKLLKIEWLGTIDVKRASSRKCLDYVLKYVAKGEDRQRLRSAGVKRVWSSSVGFLPPIFKIAVNKGKYFVMPFHRYEEFLKEQSECSCGRLTVRLEGCLDQAKRNVSESTERPASSVEEQVLFPTKSAVIDFPDGSAGLPGAPKRRRRSNKPNPTKGE
jgi:hypothetical protein